MATYFCLYKNCTMNIKGKISSKILKESETVIHFKLLFYVNMAKVKKFHLNCSFNVVLRLEFEVEN